VNLSCAYSIKRIHPVLRFPPVPLFLTYTTNWRNLFLSALEREFDGVIKSKEVSPSVAHAKPMRVSHTR
jgi:hypothetical protein